ncbi:tRNA adenosine(34) deaminase TadA [Thiosulfativibrio zosterae]|uniref:tRNA-specific adenosine deaminase n=1 Tax=Thiosulfativibrio zosterae TaxID=2675053 RepID=A0A6F8PLR9_9GAMM|nr:tRNA adenosine(34) deaminase TadA [Thiosulfativibrio zosterae]BBP43052.1 tRNA-specific adenosine deaminase [Thiosulfativibrio zosterae]
MIPICPENLSQAEQDAFWMSYAMDLAQKAEEAGEVPVGAVCVKDNQWVSEGFNAVIHQNDPTAHAEVLALRAAGQVIKNYRLIDLTLYVTLEPCSMCASALVHARVKRLVYGAKDLKTGAVDSVFQLTNSSLLNHKIESVQGVLEDKCSAQLSLFFKKRRDEKKREKQQLLPK